VCPNLIGGKNWQPMSYSPQTGLVYIPTNNVCMDWAVSEVNYRKGVFYLGAEFPTLPGPGGYLGELMAWDPVAQKKVWSVKSDLPFNGGTLTTAGGLTFWGDLPRRPRCCACCRTDRWCHWAAARRWRWTSA